MTPLSDLRRVVIYRLGSLGDTIVALPCFHQIARLTPQAERIVLTNVPVSSKAAPLEAILSGSGLVHRTVSYPLGTRSLRRLWQLRRELRALNADTLFYLSAPRGLAAAWRDVAFFRLCGFKRILGAPLSPDLQDNLVNAHGQLEQECMRLARTMQGAGPVDLDDRSMWDLRLTAQERRVADALCAPLAHQPFIAINMGGKVARNDWGIANWLTLIGALKLRLRGWGLLIVGAAEDAPRAKQIAALWGGIAVNACGQLKPRESAAAMEKAALFVGHDSGPMHLAAAMQVPCVALFGDNNPPRKWHPYGAHHRSLHHMQGVQTISPASVLEQVLHVVKQSAAHVPSSECSVS